MEKNIWVQRADAKRLAILRFHPALWAEGLFQPFLEANGFEIASIRSEFCEVWQAWQVVVVLRHPDFNIVARGDSIPEIRLTISGSNGNAVLESWEYA